MPRNGWHCGTAAPCLCQPAPQYYAPDARAANPHRHGSVAPTLPPITRRALPAVLLLAPSPLAFQPLPRPLTTCVPIAPCLRYPPFTNDLPHLTLPNPRAYHPIAPVLPVLEPHLDHPSPSPSSEFYTLLDVAVPGLLGEPAAFRRTYEGPILRGQVRSAEGAGSHTVWGLAKDREPHAPRAPA